MPHRRDQRSAEATTYRRWYHLARWSRLRAAQLQREPMCSMCLERGRVTMATVCHHVEPHKGDEQAFWDGPFASLCAPCHDADAQAIERGGKPRLTFDARGFPIW